jgi:hypothetical protein
MEEAQTKISYGWTIVDASQLFFSIGYPGVVGWHIDIYYQKVTNCTVSRISWNGELKKVTALYTKIVQLLMPILSTSRHE